MKIRIVVNVLVCCCLLWPLTLKGQNADAFVAVIVPEPQSAVNSSPGDCDLGCVPQVGDPTDGTGPTFTSAQYTMVTLGSKEYLVEYQKRSCNTGGECYIDYRINKITHLGTFGQDPYAGSALSCLMESISKKLISKLRLQDLTPSYNWGSELCSFNSYRIVHSKCWKRVNVGNDFCTVEYEQCSEDLTCCATTYYVSPKILYPSTPGGNATYIEFDVIRLYTYTSNDLVDCNDPAGIPPIIGCESICEECGPSNNSGQGGSGGQ